MSVVNGPSRVQDLVENAHREASSVTSGVVSSVYPALAEADPGSSASPWSARPVRSARRATPVMPSRSCSCAKPFVFSLVCQAHGIDVVRARIGVNATGLPFNSLAAVEKDPSSRTNPMVNAGALMSTGLLPGDSVDERWDAVVSGLSAFAGRTLAVHDATYASASASNHRNRALAMLLADRDALDADPEEVTDLYTRTSCLEVSAVDLAVMGATLAAGGVNPLTGARVVDADIARATIAVMAIAGALRDDWRLAGRRRAPRQERHRRRHRDGVAGQRRPGHLRATTRRGGQQRQGAARGTAARTPAGPGHLRVRRGLTGR